jgi:hypothetical protein
MNSINASLEAATAAILQDLRNCLLDLSTSEYTTASVHLSGATIGQHTRHVIELYTCLLSGYLFGIVNYDKRKRDFRIEIDISFALGCLDAIERGIALADKSLVLESNPGVGGPICLSTTLCRELLYNLEHAIHHMALIRVGVQELTDIVLPEHFGVAPSTIQHRQRECAQ